MDSVQEKKEQPVCVRTDNKLIDEFINYIEVIKGKSPKTASEYHYDLITFFRFLKIQNGTCPCPPRDETFHENYSLISIHDVTVEDLRKTTLSDLYEYLSFVNKFKENSSATRARKVASLRSFYKYLTVRAGLLEHNPADTLETPKVAKRQPRYLTLEESEKLLRSVPRDEFFERNLCILTLFLNCGMRVSELVGINVSDIKEDTIRILGKGNKERTVYLNRACGIAIQNYLRVRPADGIKEDRDALFISRNKRRLSTKMVWVIVKDLLKKAGLDETKYSPHKLRHTAATLLYQYGEVDVRVLQQILGHENLSTTQIYTHLNDSQLKDAVKKNPLSKE